MRETDTLTTYLDEIGRFPLLSREEEAALPPRIRSGDSTALDALVCANLRFVVVVAKQYQHRGMSLSDLIAEGNLGLVRAAERFDESRAVKFVTYAVWWIRQSILQTIANNAHAVRVPVAQAAAMRRIGYQTNHLSQELGREPTARELAAELGMSEDDLFSALPFAREALSLDAPLAADEDGGLLDILHDEAGAASDSGAGDSDLTTALQQAMTGLRERERQVLGLYFGLDGCEPATLEEIGTRFGITRERARQIKDKALSRIRRSPQRTVLATLR